MENRTIELILKRREGKKGKGRGNKIQKNEKNKVR